MTKSELKTGMLVKNSKNSIGEVLLGTPEGDLIIWYKNINTEKELNIYRTLASINMDLSFKDGTGRITTVYSPKDKRSFGKRNLNDFYVFWTKPVIEVTMDEVEKKFGHKVKIIK